MSRKLSDAGLRFIADFEGYHEALPDGRCRAYQCIVGRDKKGRPIYDGKWTIGFGCTEGVTEGMIWTREQAEQAFRRELARFEAAVTRLVKASLTQNQFDALVSFAYNVGEGKDGLGGSTLLKKLNGGDYQGASREFSRWVNSNGVKNVPGLVRRRAAEAALFLRLDAPKPAAAPEMPQTVSGPSTLASPASLLSETNFSKLNALAEQGSRLAQHIRALKTWLWGLITTLWAAATFVDPTKGTGSVIGTWIATHPIMAAAILGTIIAVILYVLAKLAEKYLLTASKSGRYKPRPNEPAPAPEASP